ncbi:homeobox protein ESX1-like [Echinops telfairi]|uniref:Homeobox protein ESX1-like n=1 Tax=Echinops telfairi TaxID=9371 RepID=A0AC55DRT7_ECHTE|nr:homeobox protein ESX1-like [Echinops telfairi]
MDRPPKEGPTPVRSQEHPRPCFLDNGEEQQESRRKRSAQKRRTAKAAPAAGGAVKDLAYKERSEGDEPGEGREHVQDGSVGAQKLEQQQEGEAGEGPSGARDPQSKEAQFWSRGIFTKAQVEELEKIFHVHQYIDESQRAELASRMNVSESRVQGWFKNRRTRWRRYQKTLVHRNMGPVAQGQPSMMGVNGNSNAMFAPEPDWRLNFLMPPPPVSPIPPLPPETPIPPLPPVTCLPPVTPLLPLPLIAFQLPPSITSAPVPIVLTLICCNSFSNPDI